VEVRSGPDYLPAPQLRRRLELLSLWFPPDRGYRLFSPSAPCDTEKPRVSRLEKLYRR